MCRRVGKAAPPRRTAFLRGAACVAALAAFVPARAADVWDVFPPATLTNDFGDVGLLQLPSGRFAEDGQVTVSGNRVAPYERYSITLQATPWLSGTLRYSTVGNRLFSNTPAFSGNQSYKDRGFDVKLRLLEEGRVTPAVAVGLRDFIGTNLFSAEFVAATKQIGPADLTFGVGWGNLANRGSIPNPFRLISSRFRDRGTTVAGGGSPSGAYFKGEHVSLFGGIQYALPVRNLFLTAEWDPNDYKNESLGNRFRAPSPVNVGIDYKPAKWLQIGAGLERGNRFAFHLAVTGNVAHPTNIPKFDPPAAPLPRADSAPPVPAPAAAPPPSPEMAAAIRDRLAAALTLQGTGLYSLRLNEASADLYVAQGRFRSEPQGLGRIARAAFSVLPQSYQSIRVVFVEAGLVTTSATIYRFALADALATGRGGIDPLWLRTSLEQGPLDLDAAPLKGPADAKGPHFYYTLLPGLKTTLGRPEQFVLYQLLARLNVYVQVDRHLSFSGGLQKNIADNFDKLVQPSDSRLPHVRSDIASYLKQGKNAIAFLRGDYNFNIAPALYGHVYGGLLEEMFAGGGGEILYRPFDSNWALGADLTWVKQRGFKEKFDLRHYSTTTGFVTVFRHFPGAEVDVNLRAGRYLAGDYGATLDISRTFRTGVKIGGFVTKTDVSAADFGEGRFDKGLYVIVPLDLIYTRNLRSSLGVLYRPLLRDGGQQLNYRGSLLGTTEFTQRYNFARDWRDILK